MSVMFPAERLLQQFRQSHAAFGFRELSAAFETVGVDRDFLGQCRLHEFAPAFCWEDEAVWPYFAERPHLLEACFQRNSNERYAAYGRKNAFDVLRAFPEAPPSLLKVMWELALGNAKSDRAAAQAVVEKSPGWQERVIGALADGAFARRAIAAQWLGKRGVAAAVEPLKQAMKQEKQDVAKAAMMEALERLDVAIEQFLNRGQLGKEAEKTVKKGVPLQLAWFPFDRLPEVHWKDNGQPVPPEIIQHFLLQAFRMKTPEPSPLLRRYCEMFDPAERERLGDFVFQQWLERDLKHKYTEDEARAEAKKNAPNHPWFYGSLPDMEKMLYETYRRERVSAIKEKGLLAVAGACCGPNSVRQIEAYLKEWYGYRASQCKALIAMLASVEHPSAVQLLLSTANRFRTKSIRQEAEKYVHLLAERKDWTIGQLADRTIPSAGFDESGSVALDFGPRQFVVKLDDRLNVSLLNEGGKAIKSLPAPGKNDDAEKAQAAKKQFAALKKELKQIVKQQTERLYESMCTERTWRFDEWDEHLLRHPIVRTLCRRLVWAVMRDDVVTQTFRPLEDGTLTDVEDNAVSVAPDATLRIAHSVLVPAETAAAWQTHLADYEVAPLFSQFGRAAYKTPEEKRSETEMTEFEGWIVETFTLRGIAAKAGYTRGAPQDGGWFHEYHKQFTGLGLQATIEFSGNSLPEENRKAALIKLYFTRLSPQELNDGYHRPAPLRLGDVPPVLLSECYQDLRAMASSGPGYRADWEKAIQG